MRELSYNSSSSVVIEAAAAARSSSVGWTPARSAHRFHASSSTKALLRSDLSLSQVVLSSEIACSVSNFSKVHFSMFCDSLSLSCCINWTARCKMLPLFFSQLGTIFAISLMPSLMVSRRRRSTVAPCQYTRHGQARLPIICLLTFFVVVLAHLVPRIGADHGFARGRRATNWRRLFQTCGCRCRLLRFV